MFATNNVCHKLKIGSRAFNRSSRRVQAFKRIGARFILSVSLSVLPILYGSVMALAQDARSLTFSIASQANGQPGGYTLPGLGASGSLSLVGGSESSNPGSDIFHGNGTATGYKLSHQNIIARTIKLRNNAGNLRPTVDFMLDSVTGAISFTQPVKLTEIISVYYQYTLKPTQSTVAAAFSGLHMNLGANTSLGIALNFGAGDSKSSLFGLDLKSNFGKAGENHYGGLIYFANGQANAAAPGSNASPISGLKQFLSQNLALSSGGAHFSAHYQDISKDFGGFQALKDGNAADKDALAQLAVMEKQKGLHELGFGFGFAAPKGSAAGSQGLSFSTNSIGDGKGSLKRDSAIFDTGKMTLEYVSRKADTAFARIADLSDSDKTSMALDIVRQFNPGATASQVTQAEKDQLTREIGLNRSGVHGQVALNKTNSFNFSQMSLTPTDRLVSPHGGVQRDAFGYSTKYFQFSMVNQSIANSFALLPTLDDLEKAQFGNEHGIKRQTTSLAWQLSKTTKIGYTDLKLRNSNDFVTDTAAAALAARTDPTAAVAAARSGLDRKTFTLDGKNFSLAARHSSVDKTFARSADVAVAAPEKAAIEADRGFQHTDLTAHLAAIKGLTLDTLFSSAVDSADKIGHDSHKVSMAYNLGKFTKFSLVDDADVTDTARVRNGIEHSNEAFTQTFGKGYILSLMRDASTTYAAGVKSVETVVQDFKFETPQLKKGSLSYENHRIASLGGAYEDTSNLNMHMKPTRDLQVNVQRLDIDRGDNIKAGSSGMDEVDVSWQATKQFAVIAGTSQTSTNNKTDSDSVSFGLKGDPIKNLTIGAKFDEIHSTTNTKDTADFSLSNSKPIKCGLITDLIVTAKYASLNDQRKLQNETMQGRLAFKIYKNEFLVDYAGISLPNGTSTIGRTYSFKTDPDPKRTFHGLFYYKVRTLVDGKEANVRNFTADWKLSKDTNFVYSFGTSPEDAQGNIRDINTANVSLKKQLKRNGTGEFFYRMDDNRITKVLTRSLGFGYDSKISSNSKFNLSYSKDTNMLATLYDRSDHVHLGFEQTLNPDHFITVSAEVRSHDRVDLQQDFQMNVDFKTKF